jgi:hypothetical protein
MGARRVVKGVEAIKRAVSNSRGWGKLMTLGESMSSREKPE